VGCSTMSPVEIVTLCMNPALDITTGTDTVRSEAVRLGVAAGAAMLLTPGTAPCTLADTERLFRQTGKPRPVPAGEPRPVPAENTGSLT